MTGLFLVPQTRMQHFDRIHAPWIPLDDVGIRQNPRVTQVAVVRSVDAILLWTFVQVFQVHDEDC